MLFHIEDVGGSDNPVQAYRYWSFVRAVTDARPMYNAAFFTTPSRSTANLMQIRWIIQRAGRPPPAPSAVPLAKEGPWRLYRLAHAPGRASVVARWTTASSPEAALRAATAPSFVPENEAVLETAPTFPRSASTEAPAGRTKAEFRWRGPQAAVVRVNTTRRAMLLVRNTFDPGWHATVDGRPVAVQPADYVAQGVPIPAGRHVVELRYDDPTIGYGLLGSLLSIGLLVGSAIAVRSRTERAQAHASPEAGSRPHRSLSKTR
jgi:hypothetical protein